MFQVLSEFPYTDDDITLIHNNPSSVASLDELLCPLLTGTKAVIATAQVNFQYLHLICMHLLNLSEPFLNCTKS